MEQRVIDLHERRRRDLDEEIERYREAATSTLEQLEWLVAYLNQMERPALARAVERNRRHILESIS